MQNKLFWNRLKNNELTDYSEIEQFIYTKKYIESNMDFTNVFLENKYNSYLKIYLFEVEDYNTEDEYNEVFFQSYLNGDISQECYIRYENKFILMMEKLFDISNTFVCYSIASSLDNNYLVKNSKDVVFEIDRLENLSLGFNNVKDKSFFRQICYISAREIEYVTFIFPDINAVVINSGLHGYLFTDVTLKKEIQDSLSSVINFRDVTDIL